jgi:hypothetical protein
MDHHACAIHHERGILAVINASCDLCLSTHQLAQLDTD